MSDEKPDGGGSFLRNPNALLALITIAGGLWLVSQQLTSDRPVTPAGGAKEFMGAQKLEARLWEDTFKIVTLGDRSFFFGAVSPVSVDLETLTGQIAHQKDSSRTPAKGVLLLPVLVSGGQYSEDQESRIRSRFAVVSALGQSGYVPADSEHIGVLRVPWLTQEELEKANDSQCPVVAQLWSHDLPVRLLGVERSEESTHVEMRYEWYRRRDFAQGSSVNDAWSWVLVLWLDESHFEDDPLLRLALLLERLTDPKWFRVGPAPRNVALVGPRQSATLRAMLDWRPKVPLLSHIANPDVGQLVSKVLQRVDVFCATPSVIDEVLVGDPVDNDKPPRAAVRARLTEAGKGFKSFHNLAATDAQLAREVFRELKLRNADPAKTLPGRKENHVVLISEWDSFYGRMLSLTYGAELAVLKKTAPNRAAFIHNYVNSWASLPENLHSFVYLRGLDGQTLIGDASSKKDDGEKRQSRGGASAPDSIEALRHWAPDVNKAEGRAQFDYLGRLGDQIEQRQEKIERANGRIKAIGIVGSDVYDTLLILQALRQRFPAALFFTTDLDVRFLHPLEREWAHNLIMVSSYGLTLHPDLQGPVAPFRDSTQTAQFAATLAALGNRELADIVSIPPRRFEVGNRTAVDLSVEDSALVTSQPKPSGTTYRWLHPLTASESYREQKPDYSELQRESVILILIMLGVAIALWRPFRRLTWDAFKYPGEALDYADEDVGGPDGAEALLAAFAKKPDDPVASWLVKHPRIVEIQESPAVENSDLKKGVDWVREGKLGRLATVLVDLLNYLLRQEDLASACQPGPEQLVEETNPFNHWFRFFIGPLAMLKRYRTRKQLDGLLDRMTSMLMTGRADAPPRSRWVVVRLFVRFTGRLAMRKTTVDVHEMDYDKAALHAADFARTAAQQLYFLRCCRLVMFWLAALVIAWVAYRMGSHIWADTWMRPDGEPFSFTSGISAWPAVVVRLLALVLAICFAIVFSMRLKTAFWTLTRRFRLSPPMDKVRIRTDVVCAEVLWHDYSDRSCFVRRWLVIGCLMVLYFYLVSAIHSLFGEASLSPIRGAETLGWHKLFAFGSLAGFLLLAFFTVEAAYRCRNFIEKLGAHPTLYPKSTRRHFSRQMGRIDDEYLDEWIDLQMIAELTERVGRMVYYPAGLVLLMLVARNSWWDCWTWPVWLMVIFVLNFILALASVVILQHAAREAKRKAEQSMSAKVKKLQSQVAPSDAQNNATQAEKLLKEISELQRGAFVPFWENPVVGAVFLSSGGTTVFQLAIWMMNR